MSRENRSAPWAVHPDWLPELSAAITGRMDPAQAAAQLERARSLAEDEEPAAGGQIALLRLHGLVTPRSSLLAMLFGVGGGGLENLQAQVRAAVADDAVEQIVLDIDSPGGLVDLVPETAELIRQARDVKPVVAVANTWAASAAYWIASAASELVVTPSGEVGSIGVYVMHDDVSKAQEEMGVTTTLISAGKYKVEGNPYEPLSREAKAELQRYVDELYGDFVEGVAEGRDTTAKDVEANFGQGRMIRPEAAVSAGMADRVDTLEGTLARLGADEPEDEPEQPDEDELEDDDDEDAVVSAQRLADVLLG